MTTNKTILLVDDDDAVRITLAANLELEGYEIIESASAGEALEQLRGGVSPALVLSDIRMPRMSGVDLFREIKLEFPETPVVLMTAFAYEEQVDGAISEGVFTILSKPFALTDLVVTLERAIRRPLVLVVEQGVAGVETTLGRRLKDRGLRVFSAGDPVAAGEALASGEVDVCVVDLELDCAEMDSVSMVRATQALPTPVTVIACTRTQDTAEVAALAGVGVRLFVSRPVDAKRVMEVIAQDRSKVGDQR